ncbi:MAG: mandelate racemase/muconate lactonizing enzyme family protein, partial [Acetobacteraceae bacterium]|nr:mandelate racemase/muconate lactonizing enzyme family protein [Acetobacteraceae bacterium]
GLAMSFNAKRVATIREMVRSLEPLVIGLDPRMGGTFIARAWKELNFFGMEGISILGLTPVDSAIWDLRGKAVGLNVAHLIGACCDAVRTYASGGLWLNLSTDELQEQAVGFVRKGFRAMKVRLGKPDPLEDVTRVKAVREAIGPDIALMADANQQLSVKQAIRLGRMLEEFDLTWYEEPVPSTDHEGEAAIAAALDVSLASGETVWTHRGVLAMLQARAADILMPDMQRMGGPTEYLKAGYLCEAYHIPVSSHVFAETSLPLLACFRTGDWLEHMPWFEVLYDRPIELDGEGRAVLPNRPGFGFSFNPEAVNRLAA